MKPKKRVSVMLAAVPILTALLAAAGCSAQGDQPDKSDKKPTHVTVWAGAGADSEQLKGILEKWGPKHGYDIDMQIKSGTAYAQGLQLALQTGKGPDVMDAVMTPALMAAGYLMPLGDLVGSEITKAYGDILDAPKPYMQDGTLFALPTQFNTVRMIVNSDAFEAAGLDPSRPPKTLGKILDDCPALVKSGVACFGLPLKWRGWATWYADRIADAGDADLTTGGLFNTDSGEFAMTKYAPVITAFRELVKKGWAYPGASSLDNDMLRAAFAQGKIAMAMSASWDVAELNDSLKTKVKWKAVNVPTAGGEKFVRNNGNISGLWAINAKTKVKKAAAAVLREIGSAKVAAALAKQAVIPVRSNVTVPKDQGQLSEYLPTKTDTATSASPAAQLQLQGETFNDVLTRLVLGDEPIEPALSKLNDRYNAALKSGVKAGKINLKDYTQK